MIKKKNLRDNLWSVLFFVALLLLTILMIVLIGTLQSSEPEKGKIVGGVFIGSVSDGGWNENHYKGLQKACDAYGLTLITEEFVDEKEEACEKAVKSLVDRKAAVIFFTSDGFGDNVKRVVESYPDVAFYTISPESGASNLTTYYGRMYQIRYLAGMIAGQMTRTNVLGYVAANSNVQVDRGVNAYLLGARSVNPDVVVKVRMTGTWFDEEKERVAAQALIDEDGADILTHHTSTSNTVDVAEANGVMSIGYNCTKTQYSRNFLASLVFYWDALYKAILRNYIKGSAPEGDAYWLGATEGVVGIENFSPYVTEAMKGQIKRKRASFEKGNDVFLGEIRCVDGTIMCRPDERISDHSLLFDMNWFVEGVEVDGE
ncbi:MAG: BMP family ABC transporter substrate-binding protein [Lachnospiraceae bacterium]|nr:BMP family ABC transporter substrate-binding protein [Lachnospiraceae bacterium]